MLLDPKRGEIWMVDFSPQIGDELRDPHPAIVISAKGIGALRLRIVVPIRSARAFDFSPHPWMIELTPSPINGLTKPCRADVFQMKSISIERFGRRMGMLESHDFENVMDAVALCLGL
jgi:mRNA interferase MazF